MIRLAFDIGGTFTDFVVHDSKAHATYTLKLPSTPREPEAAVLVGITRLLEQTGIPAASITRVLHATTAATNAVLERKGAKTALITTRGFRDVILIGRQKRYETYDLYLEKPRPLVQRRHVVEVIERTAFDGSVVEALQPRSVDLAIDQLRADHIEAVAICLLHAYANDEHERAIEESVINQWPDVAVTRSSTVSAKFREYERTSTTVANAYVKPLVARYVKGLSAALEELGFACGLSIMQSSGGLVTPAVAEAYPIRIIESGPAAGVMMGQVIGEAQGEANLITFDMGGTTAKLGAIDNGRAAIMPTFEIDHRNAKPGSGLPINVPAVELLEIGAGGGSIARADLGMVVVGPDSAGAEPGPLCYRQGGTQPTVTDANLVLGYLSAQGFNRGQMTLDEDAAEAGIRTHIAAPLGLELSDAAWGIHVIANANMDNAMRTVSVERGRDPRRYAMVALGGAGPLHAARLARSIGITKVIVPGGAGVGSAIGLLAARPRVDASVTKVLPVPATNPDLLVELYTDLEARVRVDLRRMGIDIEPTWSRYASMRYVGQGFDVHVDLPSGAVDAAFMQAALEAFNEAYLRKHRFIDKSGVVEGVDWTLVASLPNEQDPPTTASLTALAKANTSYRQAYFPETNGYVETPVMNRAAIAEAQSVRGPVIIEDPDSTTVVLPGDLATLNSQGHLIIRIRADADAKAGDIE